MMKKLLLIGIFSFATQVNAQVEIGTTAPTEKLEIVGSVAIGTSVIIDPINYVNNPSV